jgi:shikimate kinase
MNIILIGFMGAGKTTIASILAEKSRKDFIDMDTLIIQKSGRASDKEIFAKDGELIFRELEINIAKALTSKQNAIIATGGGVVMNKIILDYLKQNGVVIFLKNTFETSRERVKKNPPPLFQNTQTAQQLYAFRVPLYKAYADITIETDDKNPEKVAEEILERL